MFFDFVAGMCMDVYVVLHVLLSFLYNVLDVFYHTK